MELKIYNRINEKTGDTKRFRQEGKIPAVLYVRSKPSETIMVDYDAFEFILRHVERGCLATKKIALVDEQGKKRVALIKDIQYHPTTYDVIHLDFEELFDEVKVKVNVPIICIGVLDCPGIKLGGVLRQVIRQLRVQCLPKDLPEFYELDVRALVLNESKKLKDLAISAEIRPMANLEEVAVVIAKR